MRCSASLKTLFIRRMQVQGLFFIFIMMFLCLRAIADLNSLVSCDYDSQDIRFVLKELAGQADVNIIVDDNLQRRITLKLDQVPLASTLEMFKQAFSLEITIKDNIVVATQKAQYSSGSQTEALTSEIIQISLLPIKEVVEILQAFSSELKITAFEDQRVLVINGPYSKVNLAKNAVSSWFNKPSLEGTLKSEVVKLNYIEPQDLAYLSNLTPGIRISVLNNLKSVVVSGNKSDVEATAEIIKDLDKPPKVVQISVEMLEVRQGDLEDIGISLKGNTGYNSLSIKWDEQSIQQNPWGGEKEDPIDLLEFIRLRPWIRVSLSFLTEINLLVEEGKARVLARPSLTSLENKTAKIHTGERYSLVLYQNNYQQLQYIDVGVQLEITPRVDIDGNITAVLSPQVSSITGFSKEGYPRIATRQVSTTVRVRNGETLIIGGLVDESEFNNQQGLPILSQLPILRWIFSRNRSSKDKTELIIVVNFSIIPEQ